jgi:hypothetical protein
MGRTVVSKHDLELIRETVSGSVRDDKIGAADDSPFLQQRVHLKITPESTPLPLPETDKYTSRLLKYIPAEVIALYITLDAMIRSSDQIQAGVYWAVFLFGILGTYLYLWRVQKVNKQNQLLISVVAYCVWVFALGGPFVLLNWYEPIYGGLLLPIFTFLIPIIEA